MPDDDPILLKHEGRIARIEEWMESVKAQQRFLKGAALAILVAIIGSAVTVYLEQKASHRETRELIHQVLVQQKGTP